MILGWQDLGLMGLQAINAKIKWLIPMGMDLIPTKQFSVKKGKEIADSFCRNGLSGAL